MSEKSNEDFNFNARISRAYKDEKSGKYYIEGVASSTSIDAHRTIFSENCLRGWKEDFESGLPTYIEINHDGMKDWTKRIGKVSEVEVRKSIEKKDEEDNFITELFIRAELDSDNPLALQTFNTINNPKVEYGQPEELGLSINGYITKMRLKKIGDEVIEIYDRARLALIGVVEYPSNPDTFVNALKRSVENNILVKRNMENMSKRSEEVEVIIETDNNSSSIVENQEVRETLKDGGVEANKKAISETVELMNDVISEINKLENLKSESLIALISSLLYKIYSKFDWDISYDVYERNISNKFELLKLKEVKNIDDIVENEKRNKEMSEQKVESTEVETVVENVEVVTQEVVQENVEQEIERKVEEKEAEEVKETNSLEVVIRELADLVKSLKVDVEKVSSENVELKRNIEVIGKQPVGVVADQVVRNVEPQSTPKISGQELLRAFNEGRLTPATREALERMGVLSFYGVKSV